MTTLTRAAVVYGGDEARQDLLVIQVRIRPEVRRRATRAPRSRRSSRRAATAGRAAQRHAQRRHHHIGLSRGLQGRLDDGPVDPALVGRGSPYQGRDLALGKDRSRLARLQETPIVRAGWTSPRVPWASSATLMSSGSHLGW